MQFAIVPGARYFGLGGQLVKLGFVREQFKLGCLMQRRLPILLAKARPPVLESRRSRMSQRVQLRLLRVVLGRGRPAWRLVIWLVFARS